MVSKSFCSQLWYWNLFPENKTMVFSVAQSPYREPEKQELSLSFCCFIVSWFTYRAIREMQTLQQVFPPSPFTPDFRTRIISRALGLMNPVLPLSSLSLLFLLFSSSVCIDIQDARHFSKGFKCSPKDYRGRVATRFWNIFKYVNSKKNECAPLRYLNALS
jgi:hypothetical protein